MGQDLDLDRRVQEEIARLIREGRLQPSPDPDLERLAREYRVVPAQEARSWR